MGKAGNGTSGSSSGLIGGLIDSVTGFAKNLLGDSAGTSVAQKKIQDTANGNKNTSSKNDAGILGAVGGLVGGVFDAAGKITGSAGTALGDITKSVGNLAKDITSGTA